ncbi:MAG: LrgB family protein [Spirochaetaceae bacterium]|nr:MAG: LrgB family protein [Spirochaetaceae bacterium]
MNALFENPILWVTVSLGAFIFGKRLYAQSRFPLFHPVLVAIASVIVLLLLFDVDYEIYRGGGDIISFFLGPSVVALGLPLYERFQQMRSQAPALLVSVVAGSLVGLVSAVLPVILMAAPELVVMSMAPKSITTPIAISVAQQLGGDGSLAASFVVMCGILGGVIGPAVLKITGVSDPVAFGYALGAASHGIGTARALEFGRTEGAAGSLAICLNGIATSMLAPAVVGLIMSL